MRCTALYDHPASGSRVEDDPRLARKGGEYSRWTLDNHNYRRLDAPLDP